MSGFTDDLERIAKEVNGSKKSETMIRQLTTAREALGKTILDALANPAVTEVYRNPNYDGDPDGGIVWVLTLGEPKRVLCRLSEEKAMRVITTFAGAARIVINADSPLMSTEAVLDGSRFTASIPPAIVGGCQFNIRKKATKRFPLDDYMAKNIITVEQCQLLRQMIAERKNIVVAGGTGSGKTTFANALIYEIHEQYPDDRLLILEDTTEIQCASIDYVQMKTVPLAKPSPVTLTDLVKHTLRQTPTRVLVGELRGHEALDLLDVLNTGHPGGIVTVHADSAIKGLSRMVSLVARNEFAPDSGLERAVAEVIQVVVHIGITAEGRRVDEIVEVEGWDDIAKRYVLKGEAETGLHPELQMQLLRHHVNCMREKLLSLGIGDGISADDLKLLGLDAVKAG